MTTFSFHPVKSIATGEGGMILTNHPDLYQRLLRLRSHGINKGSDPYMLPEQSRTGAQFNRWYYEMQELGFNYRITDIQAALGLSQLRKLDQFLARRRFLAKRYDDTFAQLRIGVRPAQLGAKDVSARHLYIIRAPFGKGLPSRADFMQRLYDRGYVAQVHYMPIPMHPYYAGRGANMDDLPESRAYYEEGLTIPLHVGLTDEQQGQFLQTCRESLQ
jgi:dTDP-4-amino-4,6-dideoxygalactose transaminase